MSNFKHRLSVTGHLCDDIGLMTDRALGVLHLLAIQFESENASRMSDHLIYCTIDSAIAEIEDIKARASGHR